MSLPSKIEQLEEYAAELGMTEEELREFASHYAKKPKPKAGRDWSS